MRVFNYSLFFFFLFVSIAAADIIPVDYPFRLEGEVTVDGSAPTEDYTFSAYVDGELYKTLEMGGDGYYVITVGGQEGEVVSLYVDGNLVYGDVPFDAYGIYVQDVDISSLGSDTGSGDSGSGDTGGSSDSGTGSGGTSSGGGGTSSQDEDEDDALLLELQDEEEEPEANASLEDITVLVEGNTTLGGGEETQENTFPITGAAVVEGIKDFGVGKALFVFLLVVVLALVFLNYQKQRKVQRLKVKEQQSPV